MNFWNQLPGTATPARVLAVLGVAGSWDPSLALVMAGGKLIARLVR